MFHRAILIALLVMLAAPLAQAQDQSFAAFVNALWLDARAKGITRATFDTAMRGLTPDQRVIKATQRQPEYGKPVGDYINALASPRRIQTGLAKAKDQARPLEAVEKKYGVERWILVALWGMETDYGAAKDKWDVFRSLATLAYVKYRHPYFRNELIVAMGIMQTNNYPREQMVSSWAGAMGQSQFMPSNVVTYAVTFSGQGRPDLWSNVPDVLASTANYLHKAKWRPGLPWGFEVSLPNGFDTMKSRASFAEWTRLGVRRADGKPFPRDAADIGEAVLFFPSGIKGPAFIVTGNFLVLKDYNNSDAYAIAVGHLADRLHGGLPFRAAWPKDDRPLSRDLRIALQKRLATLGYKVAEFEGHIDFDIRDYIRAEQKKNGMVPDGNPTIALLEKIGVPVR
ncbi:lytic murein transglycosylase [Undibacter mobilis]|uniref:Lytic murein transglycosylase n=1 Tax=Undibacter mobilis TaxID=2292256 RepID=A0A371B2M3_9BRAD|nr:lytic murein transglycosylase [Undibacter mobilis]RDV01800.1 lytic murein transglycosylase [Undibacter mobilis]